MGDETMEKIKSLNRYQSGDLSHDNLTSWI